MPSPSATALASGFACLQTESGEALTFRAGSVTGVVDRNVQRPEKIRPEFGQRAISRIAIKATAVSPIPKVGELFTDENGQFHRIAIAPRRMESVLMMECEVSG